MEITLNFTERLYNEINEYCKYNDISSLQDYIISLIEKSFLIDKYGDLNTKFYSSVNINSNNENNLDINIECEKYELDPITNHLKVKIKDSNNILDIDITELLSNNDDTFIDEAFDTSLYNVSEKIDNDNKETTKVNKTRRKLISK